MEEKNMIIGCPKEIKKHEYRVGLTPHCVKAYVKAGHTVLVENGAGEGSGFEDAEYSAAGAKLVSAKEAWGAEMVVKVKEPLKEEYGFDRFFSVITKHHDKDTEALIDTVKSDVNSFVGETQQHDDMTLMIFKRNG